MPDPSNSSPSKLSRNTAPTFAPRNRLRLRTACRFIQLAGAIFVLAFFCAYFKTYTRYGSPPIATRASLHQPPSPTFPPTQSHAHRRRAFLPVRQTQRRAQHRSTYHLITLRRIRRFFSHLLNVRS